MPGISWSDDPILDRRLWPSDDEDNDVILDLFDLQLPGGAAELDDQLAVDQPLLLQLARLLLGNRSDAQRFKKVQRAIIIISYHPSW